MEVAPAGGPDAFEAALDAWCRKGVTVIPLDAPTAADSDAANGAGLIISRCAAAAFHRAAGISRDRCRPETRAQLDSADGVAAPDCVAAQRLRSALRRRLLRAMRSVDLIATPTAPAVAARHDEAEAHLTLLARTSIPWSLGRLSGGVHPGAHRGRGAADRRAARRPARTRWCAAGRSTRAGGRNSPPTNRPRPLPRQPHPPYGDKRRASRMNTTRCPLASSSVAPTSRSSRELRAPRRTARPADCSLVIEAQVSADIWLTLALDGVGWPGASQPPAPSDPGVTVSRHRALLISRRSGRCSSGRTGRAVCGAVRPTTC